MLKKISEGDILFREGDEANTAYIVKTGKLEIYKSKGSVDARVGILNKGDIVGEMSLIISENRTASVRALEDCTLYQIEKDRIQKMIKKTDPLLRGLIILLIYRLKGAGEVATDKEVELTRLYKIIELMGDRKIALNNVIEKCEELLGWDEQKTVETLKRLSDKKYIDLNEKQDTVIKKE